MSEFKMTTVETGYQKLVQRGIQFPNDKVVWAQIDSNSIESPALPPVGKYNSRGNFYVGGQEAKNREYGVPGYVQAWIKTQEAAGVEVNRLPHLVERDIIVIALDPTNIDVES